MPMATQPAETLEVDSMKFPCDGGGGALGHPKVFLHIGEDGTIDCPYCGRHYVLGSSAKPGGH